MHPRTRVHVQCEVTASALIQLRSGSIHDPAGDVGASTVMLHRDYSIPDAGVIEVNDMRDSEKTSSDTPEHDKAAAVPAKAADDTVSLLRCFWAF